MKTISIIFNHCVNTPIAMIEQFLANQFYKVANVDDVRCSLKYRKFWLLLDIWVDDYGRANSCEETVPLVEDILYIIGANFRRLTNNLL